MPVYTLLRHASNCQILVWITEYVDYWNEKGFAIFQTIILPVFIWKLISDINLVIYVRKRRLIWVISYFSTSSLFLGVTYLIRVEYNDEKVSWTQLFYLWVRLIPSLSSTAAFSSYFFSKSADIGVGNSGHQGEINEKDSDLPFGKWRFLVAVSTATGVHAFVISEIVTVCITETILAACLETKLGQNVGPHSLQKRFRDQVVTMWLKVGVRSSDKKETKNKTCLFQSSSK